MRINNNRFSVDINSLYVCNVNLVVFLDPVNIIGVADFIIIPVLNKIFFLLDLAEFDILRMGLVVIPFCVFDDQAVLIIFVQADILLPISGAVPIDRIMDRVAAAAERLDRFVGILVKDNKRPLVDKRRAVGEYPEFLLVHKGVVVGNNLVMIHIDIQPRHGFLAFL